MKIYNSVTIDILTGEIIAEDSFEYNGPIVRCGWYADYTAKVQAAKEKTNRPALLKRAQEHEGMIDVINEPLPELPPYTSPVTTPAATASPATASPATTPAVAQTPTGTFAPQERQVLDHLYQKYFGDDDNESYEDMLTRITGARIGELKTEVGQYGGLGKGVSTLRQGLENAPPMRFRMGENTLGLKPSPERIAKLYEQESGYLGKQQTARDLIAGLRAKPREATLDYGLKLLKEEPRVTMHNPKTGASLTGPQRIMPDGWKLGTYPGITQTQQAQLNIQNAGLGLKRNQLDLQKDQFEYASGTTFADVINILAGTAVTGTNLISFGKEVWEITKPLFDNADTVTDTYTWDYDTVFDPNEEYYPIQVAPSVDLLPDGTFYIDWGDLY